MRRYTESERQRIVSTFESSGLSASAFCRRRGVSTVTLAQWRKRFQRPAGPAAPARAQGAGASWLPVVITGAASPQTGRGAASYLMVCGERRLEVPQGFAPGEVRQLWQLLTEGRPDLTQRRES